MGSRRKTSPRAGASPTAQPTSGPPLPGQPQQQPEPIHTQSRLASHFDQAPAALTPAPVRRASIAEEKSKGYYPKKPDRSKVNFNCKISVPTGGGESTKLVCRNFAAEYVLASKKRDILKVFSTEIDIKKHFASRMNFFEERFADLFLHKSDGCRHLINGDEMGVYLMKLSAALDKADGHHQANVLLLSSDHAMGIHLQKKERKSGHAEAGARYFSLSFYDPNHTGNHRRVEFSEPAQLFTLMKKWPKSEYWPCP